MFPTPEEFRGQTFGIYPRVSTLQQAKDDKASLDAQIEACREYGEGLGMTLDTVCVRKEAFTSTTTERPELPLLLRDMIARNVGNLVIDRADRLTRQGMLAAAALLSRFIEAGILLHVASMGLVVRDEMGVNMFLQMAWAAQQANKARIRALVQTKRAYAKGGRYLFGIHPPYGFIKVVDEKDAKGRPIKMHLGADLRDIDGFRPWEVRRDICRWYLAGMSGWRIAERLSALHAPTSRQVWGVKHASTDWNPTTIYDILGASINEGIVTSFRSEVKEQKPNEHHTTAWKKQVDIPPDKQIPIPNAVAPDAILLTHEDAERIRTRLGPRGVGKQTSPRRTSRAQGALLIGGMARCGMPRPDDPSQPCGGTLRAKSDGRGGNLRYVCRVHEQQPHRCVGQSIRAELLDLHVWNDVFEKLFDELLAADSGGGGVLASLAEQQARLDTAGDDPTSQLRRLQGIRSEQERKKANYLQSIGEVKDADSRADLNRSLDKCNELIRDADDQIAALARAADNHEHRRAVLGNVKFQVRRYSQRVSELDIQDPADIPSIRTICRSLGVEPTVRSQRGLLLDVKVEYNLGAATGDPWFPADAAGADPKAELREAERTSKVWERIGRTPPWHPEDGTPPPLPWHAVGVPATPGPLGPQIEAVVNAKKARKGKKPPAFKYGLY